MSGIGEGIWNHFEVDLAAEEAFAADKLFPVFLHVVMMRSPIDPDLRVVQCTNPDYIFAIQPVVPSPPRSGIEEKWESRLRTLIASFKEQAGAPVGLVDVTDEGLDYAICSSWNDVPTFATVEAAFDHYREQAAEKWHPAPKQPLTIAARPWQPACDEVAEHVSPPCY